MELPGGKEEEIDGNALIDVHFFDESKEQLIVSSGLLS